MAKLFVLVSLALNSFQFSSTGDMLHLHVQTGWTGQWAHSDNW